MRYFLLFLILFSSCKREDKTTFDKKIYLIDSMLEKSKKISDSSNHLHRLADETTKQMVKEAVEKVNQLEENNNTLKKRMNVLKNMPIKTQTITIRDTVYITEKKNFWGKKKVKVENVSSESKVEDTILINPQNDY